MDFVEKASEEFAKLSLETSDELTATSIVSPVNVEGTATASHPLTIFWHEECEKHNIPNHPEKPKRVTSILKSLRESYPDALYKKAPYATDKHILLFHTEELLKRLTSLFENTEKRKSMKQIDGDTVVMWDTGKAVYRAAGAMIAAIDDLYKLNGDNHYR